MSDRPFEIGAEGVDAAAIVAEVQARVRARRAAGDYQDPRIARAERANLSNLKGDQDFQLFYLECLRDAIFVDINDFDIVERRARFSGLLVALKRALWKLLKFYTYRLWSQQNQVNGLLFSAIESADGAARERIAALEQRVAELENRSGRS
jgi:hypothetical protein